jgi:hypothetical protein
MRVADDTLRELRKHGEWRELVSLTAACRRSVGQAERNLSQR